LFGLLLHIGLDGWVGGFLSCNSEAVTNQGLCRCVFNSDSSSYPVFVDDGIVQAEINHRTIRVTAKIVRLSLGCKPGCLNVVHYGGVRHFTIPFIINRACVFLGSDAYRLF